METVLVERLSFFREQFPFLISLFKTDHTKNRAFSVIVESRRLS